MHKPPTLRRENFWESLRSQQGPILGLSPMDAVTDVSFRQIVAKHGKPDVIYTEFIPVEGIVRLNQNLLRDFWYVAAERPVLAQIYGNEPDLLYSATQLACELGFDGVDINMGCPAKSVVHRGCGAGLIATPGLAQELVRTCQQAVADWVDGGVDWQRWPVISPEKVEREFGKFIDSARELRIYTDQEIPSVPELRKEVPVSVKTRIGYSKPDIENWLPALLEVEPAAIAIHGRTLKQAYAGLADWQQIATAVELRNQANSSALILGNGDIRSPEDATTKIEQSNVDGILVGRGTFGNPWLLGDIKLGQDSPRGLQDKFAVMIEHAELHQHYKNEREFVQMRKNLAWYIKGIPGAAKLRGQLVRANTAAEVRDILTIYGADE